MLLSPGQSPILDSPILPLLSAGITNLYRHAQTISVSESHKTVSCYFLIFILPFVFLILNQPLLVLRKCLGTNCLECVTHQKRHPAMCCRNKSILEPTSATLDIKAEPFTPCLLKDACVLSQAPLHLCSSLSDSHNQKTEMSGLLRQSQQLMRQVWNYTGTSPRTQKRVLETVCCCFSLCFLVDFKVTTKT